MKERITFMPINNGNGNGNNGNSGLIASTYTAGILGEVGGGWFIEDRVDLPFVTEPEPPKEYLDLPFLTKAYRTVGSASTFELEKSGENASFAELNRVLGEKIRTNLKAYDERHWTAQWGAWRVLDEFTRLAWNEAADDKMTEDWAEATDPEFTRGELLELARSARDERAAAMPEILSQHVEFITDFMALLSMTPGSHSATYRVLHIGSLIGSYASLHYKARTHWGDRLQPGPRPRPSHLNPALVPPVPVPGHPAFPSGHATQSMLMAFCIIHVLHDAGIKPDTPDGALFAANLTALARRIARNREIAGLHYPSDSGAGRDLALALYAPLRSIEPFRDAIEAASGEWK